MDAASNHEMAGSSGSHAAAHYVRFALMIALSFFAMFGLMYAMVNTWSDLLASLNQVYMAGLMAAAMVVIELGVMSAMYPNKRLNVGLMVAGIVLLGVFYMLIREQTAIRDRQFLASMIPHHSGAILMCRRAKLADPEVRALCAQIIDSQQREIDEMNRLRAKLR
jgi:uncharacterized protein (DUF305 family)